MSWIKKWINYAGDYIAGEKGEEIQTKPKEFTFSTSESSSIGDEYEYKIKAESKEQAFHKLIQYFYGKNKGGLNEDIKSRHRIFTIPANETFEYRGMPRWFAKVINGYSRDDNFDYHQKLIDYAKEHNIELEDGYQNEK